MTTKDLPETTMATWYQASDSPLRASELVRQYGCGPIPFVGTANAFYERHLIFDRVIDSAVATARERFEAFARSVRDVLAQRWVLTKKTYERKNPKRIYYLSMEFLVGRSAANNVSNLLLDPLIQQIAEEMGIRLGQPARGGARCRLGKWGIGPSGGVLPRLNGHHAASRDRLRPTVRVRHVQAIDCERVAEGER